MEGRSAESLVDQRCELAEWDAFQDCLMNQPGLAAGPYMYVAKLHTVQSPGRINATSLRRRHQPHDARALRGSSRGLRATACCL